MEHKQRRHMPCTPDVYEAFWQSSREGRELFALSPEPAGDECVRENYVDLDRMMNERMIEGFSQEELVRLVLFDIFDKAHRILMHEPPMKPETQACFRELAFWNTIRILAGFDIEDMAKSPIHAERAKHADAIWPTGMMVRPRGEDEFVPAKNLLVIQNFGTPGVT